MTRFRWWLARKVAPAPIRECPAKGQMVIGLGEATSVTVSFTKARFRTSPKRRSFVCIGKSVSDVADARLL